MIISDIISCRKHLSRLVLSNGEELTVDTAVIAEAGLYKGCEIPDERLAETVELSDYLRAKSRALWYLERSDLSELSLFEKLRRAGIPEKGCAKAIARLKELGLIDDERYAARLAQYLCDNNISSRAIYHKLIAKGVPKQLALSSVEALDTDEVSQVLALIEKKYSAKLSDKDDIKKVYFALVRKGFSFGAVRDALKKYSEDILFAQE